MNKSLDSLKLKLKSLDKLDSSEQEELLRSLYNDHNLSWVEIAELGNSYPNKIRRLAKKLNIASRDKKDAQSNALKNNRHPHPTKDKGHRQESKIKISDKMSDYYENISQADRDKLVEDAKKRWSKKSAEEIRDMREAANAATRRAAKEGSMLEKYLLLGLINNGYRPQFHKEHFVIREKLQIDIFIGELNVAIEIDGPTHFRDIWGEDTLRKNQIRDNQKSGLLLQKGYAIIRVKQTKDLSDKHKRTILKLLLEKLAEIKTKFPPVGNRIFTIEV